MPSYGMSFPWLRRNLHQMVHSPAAWACAALILFVQVLVELAGGLDSPSVQRVYYLVGLSREGILSGKIWQPATYALLHGGWFHAGFNALLVVVIGSRILYIVGKPAFFRCLGLGILGGALLHLIASPGGNEPGVLVGVSGGYFGLLLLLTTLSPESRMMPIPVSGRSLGLGVMIAALLLMLAHPDLKLPGLSGLGRWLVREGMGWWFQMGHACHFGGGLAGWLYGRWLLRPRVSLEQLRRERDCREARNGDDRAPGYGKAPAAVTRQGLE